MARRAVANRRRSAAAGPARRDGGRHPGRPRVVGRLGAGGHPGRPAPLGPGRRRRRARGAGAGWRRGALRGERAAGRGPAAAGGRRSARRVDQRRARHPVVRDVAVRPGRATGRWPRSWSTSSTGTASRPGGARGPCATASRIGPSGCATVGGRARRPVRLPAAMAGLAAVPGLGGGSARPLRGRLRGARRLHRLQPQRARRLGLPGRGC